MRVCLALRAELHPAPDRTEVPFARLASDSRTTPIKLAALTEDGSPVEVRMLIGPATTLSAITIDVSFDEPDNALFVAEANRIRQIGHLEPVAGLEGEELHFLDFDEQLIQATRGSGVGSCCRRTRIQEGSRDASNARPGRFLRRHAFRRSLPESSRVHRLLRHG